MHCFTYHRKNFVFTNTNMMFDNIIPPLAGRELPVLDRLHQQPGAVASFLRVDDSSTSSSQGGRKTLLQRGRAGERGSAVERTLLSTADRSGAKTSERSAVERTERTSRISSSAKQQTAEERIRDVLSEQVSGGAHVAQEVSEQIMMAQMEAALRLEEELDRVVSENRDRRRARFSDSARSGESTAAAQDQQEMQLLSRELKAMENMYKAYEKVALEEQKAGRFEQELDQKWLGGLFGKGGSNSGKAEGTKTEAESESGGKVEKKKGFFARLKDSVGKMTDMIKSAGKKLLVKQQGLFSEVRKKFQAGKQSIIKTSNELLLKIGAEKPTVDWGHQPHGLGGIINNLLGGANDRDLLNIWY